MTSGLTRNPSILIISRPGSAYTYSYIVLGEAIAWVA
jgi:hypothetical protein